MSEVINNDNTEKASKNLESAFPDPTEDVFWQKVSTVNSEDSTNDVGYSNYH